MLIRHQLNSLSAVFVGALLLLLAGAWWSWQRLDHLQTAQELTLTLNNRLLRIHLNETNFLMRLDERQATQLHQEALLFKQDLETLHSRLDAEASTIRLDALQTSLDNYLRLFDSLVADARAIGFDPESGLYGSLRKAVHQAENAVKALQRDDLLVGILQLRRDEKDFMLRSDPKYVEKFTADFVNLSQKVGDDSQVRAALTSYQEDFLALAKAQTQVGLKADQGLKAELNEKMRVIDGEFDSLQGQLTDLLLVAERRIAWTLLSISVVIAALVALLTMLITRRLNRDLGHTTEVIQNISEHYDLTLKLDLKGRNELTRMGAHFNAMLEHIRHLILQSKEAVDYLSQATSPGQSHQALLTLAGTDVSASPFL
ncbi:methyl-accepting chemotaxis protein [Thiocystis violascens DSM 198]|uniref:Methyl-accepting chemotaxis protein n=1 Tax=Thiocystis violascens (strain ATCC 17096 / DSM 198 / 6111) TaxID=765911 RepID=I3YD30_THIV6|nr:methyl-accepting chemotaxis protein [Thiocystis violascens DSM 198]